MIYYPIESLVEAGIDEILIVTGGDYAGDFLKILGNGSQFGLKRLNYVYQEGEGGIAAALILAEFFADGEGVIVYLADNIVENSIFSFVEKFEGLDFKGALKTLADRAGVELKNFKDEVFIESSSHVQSLDDAKAFMNSLNGGKIPTSIPYSEMVSRIEYNMEINNIGVPVPSIVLEVMVGEMARDEKDEFTPFRKIAGRSGAEAGYTFYKLKELPNLNSVFAGVSFEDINKSIQQAVRLTIEDRPQKKQPIEDIIYY
jgi:predicted RNase H-like HicB family nuclease